MNEYIFLDSCVLQRFPYKASWSKSPNIFNFSLKGLAIQLYLQKLSIISFCPPATVSKNIGTSPNQKALFKHLAHCQGIFPVIKKRVSIFQHTRNIFQVACLHSGSIFLNQFFRKKVKNPLCAFYENQKKVDLFPFQSFIPCCSMNLLELTPRISFCSRISGGFIPVLEKTEFLLTRINRTVLLRHLLSVLFRQTLFLSRSIVKDLQKDVLNNKSYNDFSYGLIN